MIVAIQMYVRGERKFEDYNTLDKLKWGYPNDGGPPVMTQERLGEILSRQNRFCQLWEDADQNILVEIIYERV